MISGIKSLFIYNNYEALLDKIKLGLPIYSEFAQQITFEANN